VSIGYTPFIKQGLNTTCFVQHTPWDVSDGGALNTEYGLKCLDTFLRTASGDSAKWDFIQFNFGLHDIDQNTIDEYAEQLSNITKKLKATKAKLLYATTTPAPYSMGSSGANIINELNTRATKIMGSNGVPIVDLYGRVTSYCGTPPYKTCTICRKDPCSYHYDSDGYKYISEYNIPIISSLLTDEYR